MKTQRIATALMVCGIMFMTGCPAVTDPLIGTGVPAVPGTPVPDDLVGQWQTILTYVPANYEYQGGLEVKDMIGSYGIFYFFTADGQYQVDLRAMATYYDFACNLNGHRREWGTVEIVGADFTFHPAHAFESNLNSCGDSQNIDPAPTQTQTLTLLPEVDATGWPVLRVIFPDGEELLLERCRDCE